MPRFNNMIVVAVLEYHLLLARDLHLLNNSNYEQLAREVTKVNQMLTPFIQKLTADD